MGSYNVCVICGSTFDGHPGVCSSACLAAAEYEVRRNVARLRVLQRLGIDEDRRYSLAARNGQLTAAVLTWGGHRVGAPRPGETSARVTAGERRVSPGPYHTRPFTEAATRPL